MLIARICAVVAPEVPRPFRHPRALLVLMLLAGCAGRPAPPPPPPTAQSLQDGVVTLASNLVAHAQLPPPPPSGRYPITIDPWIDATTGNRVVTTKLMQTEIETLAPQHFPQLEPLPFTEASLARRPLVLLGAIEPVAAPGSLTPVQTAPGAYRIYGVLADLQTGRIAAAESAWVRPDDVNLSPLAFDRNSPAWLRDESTASYLRTSASRPADPIDPAYLQNLKAEALLTDAASLYDRENYQPALARYRQAAALPQGGHQFRVYNGLYLTTAALGERRAAAEAFGDLIGYGLEHQRLAVKFLFQPGSVAFWPDPDISGSYPMWLREIAQRTAGSPACLRIIGHASPSGDAAFNDRLSLARAERIQADLIAIEPNLRQRTAVQGEGARNAIVGNGRDDETDVLDRRVDFQLESCRQRVAAN
jgi:outer membrane protein OmpA-like peptidoglycan-associated protein